ncbi:MAG: toxin-antitoxin (TA) system antitoxin [Acidobacteriota bacterium]|jgi:antitoxin (DNA-binding transcriptional repressor) of toxin-antitoxin stability system|nr:toxin-antitoxin (TA) system antitoxin [Acidobacteriota bacterium]
MTKILNINEKISIQTVIALTKNGDEVVIEDNGEPLVKVIPIKKLSQQKVRVAGLGKGTMWMSDDFEEELPDEFWGFDKEL